MISTPTLYPGSPDSNLSPEPELLTGVSYFPSVPPAGLVLYSASDLHIT